jgi:hypothetical protein
MAVILSQGFLDADHINENQRMPKSRIAFPANAIA